MGISAYQSAAFGLAEFRAHLAGDSTHTESVTAAVTVDRDIPDSAWDRSAVGDRLLEPREFQAGGVNLILVWSVIGTVAIGVLLVVVVPRVREGLRSRPRRLLGITLLLVVLGGGIGAGTSAMRAVPPLTDPRTLPAPIPQERWDTIEASLTNDGYHIDALASARATPEFEETLRTSLAQAEVPLHVAVVDATRVDVCRASRDDAARAIAAHLDDGVRTLVLSSPGPAGFSAGYSDLGDAGSHDEWGWDGTGVAEMVDFYADPSLHLYWSYDDGTVLNQDPLTDIRPIDPAAETGLNRVVVAGVPLGGALAGFGVGALIVGAGAAGFCGVCWVRAVRRRRAGRAGGVRRDGRAWGAGSVVIVLLVGTLYTGVTGTWDAAPASAAPDTVAVDDLAHRIGTEGGISIGADGAGTVPPVRQSVIDEVLDDFERDATHDFRLSVVARGPEVDVSLLADELREPGALLSFTSLKPSSQVADVEVEMVAFTSEDYDTAGDVGLLEWRERDLTEWCSEVDWTSWLVRLNPPETMLRVIAARAADPDAPLPPEYVEDMAMDWLLIGPDADFAPDAADVAASAAADQHRDAAADDVRQ